MTLWGKTDNASNSVKWAARSLHLGSGTAAQIANNTALYNNTTPNAFFSKMEVGQFAVTKAEIANGGGESAKTHGPGWTLRRMGMGPATSITVAGGTGFGTGETVILSGGQTNVTLTLTSNATGNLVSASIPSPGGVFQNTSVITKTYQRELHPVSNATVHGATVVPGWVVANITITGAVGGYTNTDTFRASNGSVNAVGTVVTIANGGLDNTSFVFTNRGSFPVSITNSQVIVSLLAANGAVSNGVAIGGTATTKTVVGTIGGYSNTDTFLFSNGTVNSTGTVTTGANGILTNTSFTFANLANRGLWANNAANSSVVISVFAANGAVSNGANGAIANTAAIVYGPALETSTANGTLTVVLGGRAGRVTYETLAVVKAIAGGNTSVLLPS